MTLHVALELGGGRDPADIEALARAAIAAEEAGVALVTLADEPVGGGVRIEAGVRAAFLARRTARIGLAPQLHVTATEPFHLATQLASLDHASLGRAAWVVGAANTEEALATIGRAPLDAAGLRREVDDVIDVARRLWDSWEDDAVIRDVPSGRFLDRDRVHHVSFEGATFSIAGPLITPRPPQGQLVVLGADALGVTARLDVALVGGGSIGEVRRRAELARAGGAPLVFADFAGPRPLPELLAALDGVVDGVRLHPAAPDDDLAWLSTVDKPPLRATLRETLGLPRPENRYATSGRETT
ncbi:LLM class flavin-dependent oxidoreductase [Dactylosporangium salmoneum]|uniref:LLM class flavin-dependent oxidoreductase n=1 Tax=Dactylosporangium salmoneum TaxID=53361 RepID=A0ABN3FRJ3_9ACTN